MKISSLLTGPLSFLDLNESLSASNTSWKWTLFHFPVGYTVRDVNVFNNSERTCI